MGRSKRRSSQAAKSPSRSPRLGLVALSLALLAIVGWASLRDSTRGESRTRRARGHTGSDIDRDSLASLRELRQQFGEMLALVARLDPEAATLRTFHDQHAGYGFLDAPGHIFFGRAFTPPSAEAREAHDFGIVVASTTERRLFGFPSEMQWEYNLDMNILTVPRPESVNPVVGGVMFCHELLHARDLLTGIEPPGLPRTDPAFAAGEVRAHELEIRLFEAISEGRYRRLLGESLDRLQDVTTSSGWLTTRSERTLAEIDRLDAAALPALRSEDERSSRRGRHFHALNYLIAERAGRGTEGKIAFEQHSLSILDGLTEEEVRP